MIFLSHRALLLGGGGRGGEESSLSVGSDRVLSLAWDEGRVNCSGPALLLVMLQLFPLLLLLLLWLFELLKETGVVDIEEAVEVGLLSPLPTMLLLLLLLLLLQLLVAADVAGGKEAEAVGDGVGTTLEEVRE